MIVKDLIIRKDYDYISWRVTHPDFPDGIFTGSCRSSDGILISNDQDYYSPNEEVLWYEEWSQEDIKNGLTILVEGYWMS